MKKFLENKTERLLTVKTTRKEGRTIDATILREGMLYMLECSVNGGETFNLGPYGNIVETLRNLDLLQLNQLEISP
jgi:hypothetical protein